MKNTQKNLGHATITIQLINRELIITNQNGEVLKHINADSLQSDAWYKIWDTLESLDQPQPDFITSNNFRQFTEKLWTRLTDIWTQ